MHADTLVERLAPERLAPERVAAERVAAGRGPARLNAAQIERVVKAMALLTADAAAVYRRPARRDVAAAR